MRGGKRFYAAVPAVSWRPDEGAFRYDPDRLRVVVSAGPAPRMFCLAEEAAVRSALSGVCDTVPDFMRVLDATERMKAAWRGFCLYLAAAATFKSAANAVSMEVRDWSASPTRRENVVPHGTAELLKLLKLGWDDTPANLEFVRGRYGTNVADRYEEIRDGVSGTALTALLGLDVKTDALDVVLGGRDGVLETLSTDCVIDLGRSGAELTALAQALKGTEFDALRSETTGVYLEMNGDDDTWRVGSPTTGFRSAPHSMTSPSPQAAPVQDEHRSEVVPEESLQGVEDTFMEPEAPETEIEEQIDFALSV